MTTTAAVTTDILPSSSTLMAHLDHCRVDFCFSHSPNQSSGPTVTAQIVLADGRPMLVVSAERMELAQIGRAVRARKVTVATPTQLASLGLPANPPGFGRLLGLKTVLDASLLEYLLVRVPSGVAGLWVEMSTDDFAAMERPVVASVSGQKKALAVVEPEPMACAS